MSIKCAIDGSDLSQLTKGSEKRVALVCDVCLGESQTTYGNFYNSQKKRNFDGLTFCRKCALRMSARKRIGKIPWNKGIRRSDINGEKSPNWKGGAYVDSSGYRMVTVANRFDCKTAWRVYRREHVAAMEAYIGRALKKGEIVHHIDKNKLNNDLSNLHLTNHSDHRKSHDSLEKISALLYTKGLVLFDKNTGLYTLSEELKLLCKLD